MASIVVLLASPAVGSQGKLRRGDPPHHEKATTDIYETRGRHHRVLATGPGGIPSVVEGNLGHLGVDIKEAGSE